MLGAFGLRIYLTPCEYCVKESFINKYIPNYIIVGVIHIRNQIQVIMNRKVCFSGSI